ncbi:3-phosphoshikimate 1-carboxyvinyltransferase [Fictibacillus phosphorivorans]|uniref:3-phosphoshikimate 1-carboxyvinyltransferase n=1 Tax=Fictibacillus phosphorivorans TaxID=1221500 RepID=UPI00203ACDC4|nr:3-phosphoshikimate 1-carboxyvinyltransferase [Fictibacillus phosphorivorans]MCM3719322.1 3-phosphoshikimate 1-carboxyvinyltransferase [Fictibacillus phosphorivorans]MCM3776943.1 3-phosphoshikimate 1-carboxyvinyltransferase [Fictibacillus phosphorivorans]
MKKQLTPIHRLNGTIKVPGDKSISHRSVMFGSIAEGKTTINGFLTGEDCLSTISCFKKLGVNIVQDGEHVTVEGSGISGLKQSSDDLYVGNSGTTIRLMLGILANTSFSSVLTGDESIAKRPMNRVTKPLREMGAEIEGNEEGNKVPLHIKGGNVKGIHYHSPIASAQVKSAILLAGLQGEGTTSVTEPLKSRDHTERMLEAFGVELKSDNLTVSIDGGQQLKGTHIEVPGDISSAAFFLVAGAIVPESTITLQKVGLNPTRTGILDVLHDMGAEISYENVNEEASEPYGDLVVKTSSLKGTVIEGDVIPRLIDEIPIIALAATQAEGETIIKDAQELRVKETDRIETVVNELQKMGAQIEATEDGMIIHGKSPLKGASVQSYGDHRIGMMLSIAACLAEGETTLDQSEAVAVSYPSFFDQLQRLSNP